ncbi:oligoendopeptidase F [Alicyclobacillus mali]|uniref:Oligopeptidase F n=1 Tax=Alicyclobacillus mali (ex Roth et al. 2021) TaxID=1123961 RepID=A0ABS0F5M0_9BACL|nr:oligoendopeptidase F [Alicyclobacillus mali (ex Roth et al. 2021)]MBF8378605.1 oligoendopeptidase F [Alicyclobacillus mali (ex Roth et al. 2021)]
MASQVIWARDVRGKTRQEIDPEFRWNLEDIYPDQEAWREDAHRVRALAEAFAEFRGRLNTSGETLLQALQAHDELGQILAKLFVYAKMKLDEDATESWRQALFAEAQRLAAEIQATTSFFYPELVQLAQEQVEGWLKTVEGLGLYGFFLEETLRQRDHVLTPAQEELLAQFSEVLHAPSEIFEMYNNADTVFPVIRDENGEDVQVTHALYHELLERRDRGVRERAFHAVYDTYKKHRNTIAALYAASVKRNTVSARVRRYPSALDAALDGDRIPRSVYENLIGAVRESVPALQSYLALRKRALGLDELHMWDLYVPLVGEIDWKVPYAEARETVLRAVEVFGEAYASAAREGLYGRWVDVYETRGKRSGGYSWGTYGTHPYILLNYTDSVQDMFTLAHELGHSMHSYFSRKTQPYIYSDYTIFVAEVASTVNEAILYDHLLGREEDPLRRAYLLNRQVETIRTTLVAQTLYAEFEKGTHERIESGGAITADWLDETFYELNRAYYAPAVTVDDDIAHGWMRIPHFYSAFYVYKYATGISAALALVEKIRREGGDAVARYLQFLSGGSSNTSIELLRLAGVDMTSEAPVHQALERFKRLTAELADLLAAR